MNTGNIRVIGVSNSWKPLSWSLMCPPACRPRGCDGCPCRSGCFLFPKQPSVHPESWRQGSPKENKASEKLLRKIFITLSPLCRWEVRKLAWSFQAGRCLRKASPWDRGMLSSLLCLALLLSLGLICYCCPVAKSCLPVCDPMDFSTPGFPVLHQLPELV